MSTDFHRIRRLPPYVFEEVNKIKARLRAEGTDIIDFGMSGLPMPKSMMSAPALRAAALARLTCSNT